MMLLILAVGAVVGLAAIAYSQPPDESVDRHRIARWVKRVALIPLGLIIVFSLLMGIGEMAGGDLSGAGHLIPDSQPVCLCQRASLVT